MWYVNKQYKLKVNANSKKEAIYKMLELIKKKLSGKNTKQVTAMSYPRKELAEELKSQTVNIISWWCLCWYLSHIQNKGNLLKHEKGKLKGLLVKLNGYTCKDSNTEKTKENILIKYWINLEDYDKNPEAVMGVFYSKFTDEGISDKELSIFHIIGKEFGKESKKIIQLISRGTPSEIRNYVDKTFPS